MANRVALTPFDRPNSYVGRSVPRAAAGRHAAGRGHFIDDMTLPRMVHVAFVRSPHAHARIDAIRSAAARSMPGVVAVGDRRRARPALHALGRRADPSAGAEIGAAAGAGDHRCALAGRAGGRGRGRQPRDRRGRRRAGRNRLYRARAGGRCRSRARPWRGADPRRSGRQPRLGAQDRCRRGRPGIRTGRPCGRGIVRLRPAYRGLPGAPRGAGAFSIRATAG